MNPTIEDFGANYYEALESWKEEMEELDNSGQYYTIEEIEEMEAMQDEIKQSYMR